MATLAIKFFLPMFYDLFVYMYISMVQVKKIKYCKITIWYNCSMMLLQSCYVAAMVKLRSLITLNYICVIMNITAIQPRISIQIKSHNSWRCSGWIRLQLMLSLALIRSLNPC